MRLEGARRGDKRRVQLGDDGFVIRRGREAVWVWSDTDASGCFMSGALSEEPPKKKEIWGKYFAERGVTRPPMAKVARSLMPETTVPAAPAEWPKYPEFPSKPALSPELSAAVDAIGAFLPGVTMSPFITGEQREVLLREKRRLARRKLLRAAGVLAVLLLTVPVVANYVFNRVPPDEQLTAQGHKIAAEALGLYSSKAQPFQADADTVEFVERIDWTTVRYEAQVTIRLRKDLFGPAQTNGTVAYRMLQQSLFEARQLELKLNLFPASSGGPQPPELPVLVQRTHRVGTPLVIKVPVTADRFGWRWRLSPADYARRSASATLQGLTIENYEGAPYLIFGTPESMTDVRKQMAAARDYIIAVKREAQLRTNIDPDAPGQPNK